MSPENVQEAEQYGEQQGREFAGACGELTAESRQNIVAFKFGGTSLLGAERMLHAARLVKQAAPMSRVVVVVSAMKGVTDRLLTLAQLVDSGNLTEAKRNADSVLRLHADVLFDLQLDEFDHQRVWHDLRLLGRDVLQPLLESGLVPVVTGFVGATRDGRVTTLGRNSSDYSGAIVAHVVDANELVVWTDVDGVYTANPNESSEARLLHQLSYEEAHALAAAGAKV